MKKQTDKLWGSAFTMHPSDAVMAFTAGRDVRGVPPADAVLILYDIVVNQAHCVMLVRTGCIPEADGAKLLDGLNKLKTSYLAGIFTLDPHKEDVHTAIESFLTDKFGIDVAGKLHTARSRNDQIVTDMKLYLRVHVQCFIDECLGLVQVLLKISDKYKSVPFPGFTHHQHAMVTTFGHVLAGYASMMLRDIVRLEQWIGLHNHCPLGNTASYGTSYPIDRKMTAAYLGFDGPDHNSLDAISSRGEPEADFVYAMAICMNHLSGLSETLIQLCMPEFGMLKLSDLYSTGSSIMPQKKNPDPLEIIKGKAGFTQGQLQSLLSIGKGNFMGYNRDSQWTKYIVTDCIRECAMAPTVLSGVLETMTVYPAVMEAWCHKGFIGATALMECLARQHGLSMRQAKMLVEHAVKLSEKSDMVTFDALTSVLAESHLSVPVTEEQVRTWQTPQYAIAVSSSYGGPGKNSMKAGLSKMKKQLMTHRSWLRSIREKQKTADRLLQSAIDSIVKGGEKYEEANNVSKSIIV